MIDQVYHFLIISFYSLKNNSNLFYFFIFSYKKLEHLNYNILAFHLIFILIKIVILSLLAIEIIHHFHNFFTNIKINKSILCSRGNSLDES